MRSASMRSVIWVAWDTASPYSPPSGRPRVAQVRNSSALPRLDSRSRRAGFGDDQDGLELVDRLSAGLGRGVLGELVDPGTVHRIVAGLGPAHPAGIRGTGYPQHRIRVPHRGLHRLPRKAHGQQSDDAGSDPVVVADGFSCKTHG
jgi:hypothetical protein